MPFSTDSKIKTRKCAAEIALIALGLILVLSGWLGGEEKLSAISVGVGCSLVAGSLASFLAAIFYARAGQAVEIFSFWGLKSIFRTRQIMNQRCDVTFDSMREHLDIIAWGLNSFRSSDKADRMGEKIVKGLRVRILAPDPKSPFTDQQDKDENIWAGTTADSIEKLRDWVESLRSGLGAKNAKGSIELRFYNFRPQDFYWRQDKYIYVGPYLYGLDSQQIISFEYEAPSHGFDLYEKHFEKVWAAAAARE